ncbi:MAG: hypothetical protein WD928_09115 [Gammaproteobacteria bacterium]
MPPTPPVSSRTAHSVITALALLELLGAIYAVRATIVHRAFYAEAWQWRAELGVFMLLGLTGLGLLRRRRWALQATIVLLYGGFFAVLALLSFGHAQAHLRWWYWCLPALLPALGWMVYMLRSQRQAFQRRW